MLRKLIVTLIIIVFCTVGCESNDESQEVEVFDKELVKNNPFNCDVYEVEGEIDISSYRINYGELNVSKYCYKLDSEFNDKNDVVLFLKDFNTIDGKSIKYYLWNYIDQDEMVYEWDRIKEDIEIEMVDDLKIFSLTYATGEYCPNSSEIKISSNGYVYDVRICGK